MEYAAFKALVNNDGALYSPVQGTRWTRRNGRFSLPARNWDDGYNGAGVYAATWDLVRQYPGDIYLVVPYAVRSGRADFILGTLGWRAERAEVVCGPLDRQESMPLEQAEQILHWHRQGYRQVPGILLESIRALGQGREELPGVLENLQVDRNTGVIISAARSVLADDTEAAWAVLWLGCLVYGPQPDGTALERIVSKWNDDTRRCFLTALDHIWAEASFQETIERLELCADLFPFQEDTPEMMEIADNVFDILVLVPSYDNTRTVIDAIRHSQTLLRMAFGSAARMSENVVKMYAEMGGCVGMSRGRARNKIIEPLERRLKRTISIYPWLAGYCLQVSQSLSRAEQWLYAYMDGKQDEKN